MADFVFNVAKGRVAEFHNRVDQNDPAASELVLLVVDTSATDATLKDLDTVAAVLADANTAEVTNTNYARIDLTDTDLATIAADDTNDDMECAIPESTWSAIAAGTGWTDIIIAYDPTGVSADSALIPLTCHDFVKTPDGSDIVVAAGSYFRAT